VEGANSVGIPNFENQNGRLMEADGGASIIDLIVRDGTFAKGNRKKSRNGSSGSEGRRDGKVG
jgi:hypothetical protein